MRHLISFGVLFLLAIGMLVGHPVESKVCASKGSCDYGMTSLTLNSASYANPNLSANISWVIGSNDVKIIMVAAPVYFSDILGYEDGAQVYLNSATFNGSGTTTMVGTAPSGTPPTGYTQVGWRVQIYASRPCDNTIIGWSNEILVSP